jgi:MFS family permease
LARLDRIPVWGMAYIFLGILGMGSLFTFFDIFNINVSIIQAGSQIFGISPTNPVFGEMVASVVAWNLVGYIVGALILGPTSDRIGRRIGGLPPIPQVIHPAVLEKPSYRESLRSVFGNRTYAVRWILLALMWVFAV